jgi:uncharacterized protein involved in exopolysaccharide biosynthesis
MNDVRFDAGDTADRQGAAWAVAPVLEHWRLVLLMTALAAALSVLVSLLIPRKYEARTTLAAISNSKLPGGIDAGLASSLLGGAISTG